MGFAFSMSGVLENLTIGNPPGRVLTYRVVFLDRELERRLFGSPKLAHLVVGNRLRARGEIEDQPIDLAWQSAGDRGHYMMISPALCKQLELRLGSEVTIRFDVVASDHVVVPPDVERRLTTRAADRKRWAALTPGQRRALLAFVSAAKTDATRARRIVTLFEPLTRMQSARRSRSKGA